MWNNGSLLFYVFDCMLISCVSYIVVVRAKSAMCSFFYYNIYFDHKDIKIILQKYSVATKRILICHRRHTFVRLCPTYGIIL
jgi:hypothetical protein